MILINGNFLCRNLTGIERFAWETCRRLDELVKSEDDIAIYVPKNAKVMPEFRNIRIIKAEEEIKSFPKWDLMIFRWACKKFLATGLNFSNTAPLGKMCGFAFIHDIYAHDFPEDFKSKKEKLIRLYSKINYRNICKNAKKILTVSEFSKKQIQKAYGVKDERIEVIPNGWEHFRKVAEDNEIFNRFPELEEGKFYFTLGSLQKRKNLKWIAKYASAHKNERFAISGKVISGLESEEISELKNLNNVTLLGYVSDEEVKALMKKCKAFVFPSYYEGFGIPPLEALSAGAKIIVASAASLPEIYGDAAAYIQPDDTNCELEEKLAETKAENAEKVLGKFTYENAAKKLYGILFENPDKNHVC
ncbi:MAG: glycosyltransferase family 4 protein [Treponema sp.]|nr:glycosyltransferase family 4 protein [Treponema sp.]